MTDVAILGSGFAGSLLAHVLADSGCSVCLIDPNPHPRISLGESSTPIADLWLRLLARRFELPWLADWSRWSTLRKEHPHLNAGLKRGFSYFQHRGGQPIDLAESSLIAASDRDEVSDSHLWRADFDAELFDRSLQRGVQHRPGERVTRIEGDRLTLETRRGTREIRARWIVDATGPAAVTAKLLGSPDRTATVRTRTRCRYSHRLGVLPVAPEYSTGCDPFAADDAAVHHLCDDAGWVWMLRFADGRCSVGVVERWRGDGFASIDLRQYPDLWRLLASSSPLEGGDWRATGANQRLQRRTEVVSGRNVLRLPAAAATLDPLHSTGLGLSLAAVDRIADVILGQSSPDQYAKDLDRELDWIDEMVSAAYDVMGDFHRFEMATWVFITAAIATEERLLNGRWKGPMFGLDDQALHRGLQSGLSAIGDHRLNTDRVREVVLSELQPWNVARLGTRSDGRYAYTATKV